jgi:hypothetical protein
VKVHSPNSDENKFLSQYTLSIIKINHICFPSKINNSGLTKINLHVGHCTPVTYGVNGHLKQKQNKNKTKNNNNIDGDNDRKLSLTLLVLCEFLHEHYHQRHRHCRCWGQSCKKYFQTIYSLLLCMMNTIDF